MKKVTIIIGILCSTVFSCNHGDKYYNPDKILVDERVEYTDSIILSNGKELSNAVVGLYSIDNYIILIQNNRDSVLRITDMNNDSFVASFGKIGRARNEFQNIPQRAYCIKDEKGKPMLCIQENTCTKLVDIKNSVETSNCVMSKVIKEKKIISLILLIISLEKSVLIIRRLVTKMPEMLFILRQCSTWKIQR